MGDRRDLPRVCSVTGGERRPVDVVRAWSPRFRDDQNMLGVLVAASLQDGVYVDLAAAAGPSLSWLRGWIVRKGELLESAGKGALPAACLYLVVKRGESSSKLGDVVEGSTDGVSFVVSEFGFGVSPMCPEDWPATNVTTLMQTVVNHFL